MNAFNFVDEAIKGAIQFVFGFFHSTFLLYARPLTGGKQLYLRAKAPDTQQISSPTYLAICILFATPFLLSLAGSLDLPVSTYFAGLAKEITSGQLAGFGPLVGGTIAGTIFLSAVLRTMAWAAGLGGRKRERLVIAGEYQFGLLVVGLALFAYGLDWLAWSYLGDEIAEDLSGYRFGPAVGDLVETLLFQMLLVLALAVPSITAAISLWSSAGRSPAALLRARIGMRAMKNGLRIWKPGPREDRIRAKEAGRELYRRFLGVGAREQLTLRRRMTAGFWMSGVAYGGMLVAILLAGGAVGGGAYATNWLLSRDAAPGIELVGLECGVDGSGAVAAAVVWNRSDQPKIGWRGRILTLDIEVAGPGAFWVGEAQWTFATGERVKTDVLLPGQAVEVSGPIHLPAEGLAVMAKYPDYGCSLPPSADFTVAGGAPSTNAGR